MQAALARYGYNATLRYDPLGRLYEITDGNAVTHLVYSGDDLIAEYDGTTGAMLTRYVHGLGEGDDPLLAFEGSSFLIDAVRNLYRDRLGSIVLSTDSSDSATHRSIYSYDAYGRHDGSTTGPGAGGVGRFGYTGQAWLPEVGLYHYKARAYSPSLGRFMQADPIGYADGMNIYAYVGNNPANGTDPTGLDDCGDGSGEICVVGSYGIIDWSLWEAMFSMPYLESPSINIGAGRNDDETSDGNNDDGSSQPQIDWRKLWHRAKDFVCRLPSVAAGGGLDAYLVVGGSVSGAVSFNPSNGQISIGFDDGVGLGIGGGGRVSAGKFAGLGSPSTETLPIAGGGINVNATAVAGPVGATGSYQLLGSNKGDWGLGYTGGAELSANVNISGHGQFNLPALYELGC